MKTYMPLNGLRWSRNSGSANCDMPQSAVFGRPGGYQQDRDTKSQEQQMAGTLNDSTFGSDNTFIYKDFILTTEIKRLRVLCCL